MNLVKTTGTIGGLTLVSRIAGFAREMLMSRVMGASWQADAFFVAFRLPNTFRRLFGEGAFSAGFVPLYAQRLQGENGETEARHFSQEVLAVFVPTLIIFTLLFEIIMPLFVAAISGYQGEKLALATFLTRITFPYLLLMTLVTLYSGILNSIGRFATAAAAPILLNVTMVATLATAVLFPTPGHAAAWGVLIAGVLEVLLVGGAALRADVMTALRRPRLDADVKRFFKALGPATVGSAGVQLALFADTIIASFLAAGALSALYYADRLYQLPGGVIGIAVGTVLLPEMSRRLAAGDTQGARAAQERAIAFTLLLAIPCVAAFLVIPDLIMQALFARGKFTTSDAQNAALTLAAYTIGLVPFVLMRSVVATFLARQDTATTVKAALTAAAVNIALKIVLLYTTDLAQVGLALATSVGAWINFGLLIWFGKRAGFIAFDRDFWRAVSKLMIAGAVLALALGLLQRPVLGLTGGYSIPALLLLAAIGAAIYCGAVLGLFGKAWIARLWRTPTPPSVSAPPAPE